MFLCIEVLSGEGSLNVEGESISADVRTRLIS